MLFIRYFFCFIPSIFTLMKNVLILLSIIALLFLSCNQAPKGLHEEHQYTNALVNESSPYLLQHAHNPVNWMPWGEAALEKAKKENKLLLISVGYSACHWCHVMERETFEDSTAAAFMNEHFVAIKVDREERPDVDQIYMDAVQAITGSGGWPLNCFALSDGRPVHGGTYFQQDEWMKVMQSIVQLKEESPEKLEFFAEQLMKGLQDQAVLKVDEDLPEIDPEMWRSMVQNWKSDWDTKYGGANSAPKFPMPNSLDFLLHFGVSQNDPLALEHVYRTLNHMAKGGIYDHIGGGFARYSTDQKWKAPHFEKMLYDNAQLIELYSLAYQNSKNQEYKRIVEESIAYLKREMSNGKGAFYAALDADSEGEEGKFYTWTKDQIDALPKELQKELTKFYEINQKGAWEGKYILLREENDEKAAEKLKIDLQTYQAQLASLNSALLQIRGKRERPGLDDKVLCSWNALAISGLCAASRSLKNEEYKRMAIQCGEFLWTEMQTAGKLKHTYKNGKSSVEGHLDDYAYLAAAYLDLYQLTFDEAYIEKASILCNTAIDLFRESNSPYFYFTSKEEQQLILRKQELEDNVIPSGNSTMAKNLFLLGTLLDRKDFKKSSESMLNTIAPQVSYGQYFSNWAKLGLWMKGPFYEVAITGEHHQEKKEQFDQHYLPQVLFMGGSEGQIPLLQGKFLDGDNIFVCQNKVCQFPVIEVDEALQQMP